MEAAYDFSELTKKAKQGLSLSEGEESALKEHLSIKMMSKQSFDFGAIEERLQAGRLEELALCGRNAQWAKNGPSNSGGFILAGGFGDGLIRIDDCKPASSSPQYMGPFFSDVDGGGITRMLNRFRAQLAELKETGRLIP